MGRFVTYDKPLASISWTDSASSNAAASPSHTFSSMAIGTAHVSRHVFVAVDYGIVTGVTVGGITAAQVISVNSTYKLYRAAVPTGTTASVVVTLSAGTTDCLITVWAAYHLESGSAYDTASVNGPAFATSHSMTLNIPERGILLASASDTAVLSSWSGVTNRHDETLTITTFDQTLNAANSADLAAQTNRTLTATWSTSRSPSMLAASFQ